jgi:peptide/nickel transport system permease protein
MSTTSAVLPARGPLPRVNLPPVLRVIARNYLLGRLLKAAFTVWTVVTLTFFLIRLMPGNPIDQIINQLVSQYGVPYVEARDQAAALFSVDLNEPVASQYVGYMRRLLRGDLGSSLLSKGTPISSIIVSYLPWTLFSIGTALLISFTLGIGLGMLIAYRRESWLDHVLSTIGSLLHSIPNYLLAIVIIVFLGVQWRVLPVTQMRGALSPGMQPGLSLAFVGDVLFHAALPIATYVLTTVGTWMLTMKASTVSTLDEDYVAFGKAKGLPEGRLVSAYVGRNAVLPLFTQLSLSMGFVFGGAVVIENIFVYRGIGNVLLSAVNGRDYPVMQGIFLVTTAAVVVANLLADLLYSRIDPRVRLGSNA